MQTHIKLPTGELILEADIPELTLTELLRIKGHTQEVTSLVELLKKVTERQFKEAQQSQKIAVSSLVLLTLLGNLITSLYLNAAIESVEASNALINAHDTKMSLVLKEVITAIRDNS